MVDSDLQVIKHQTVALCMIVKDEEDVILRALKSVRNIVDYYCICDTGSSDNTVKVIEDYLDENNFSGEVHQRPWKSFSENRSEAFDLAQGKCDYLMTLDADEVFALYQDGTPDYGKRVYALPKLKGDRVQVQTYTPGLVYHRSQFFRDAAGPWSWVCPVHEVCVSENEKFVENLKGCCIIPNTDGARAKDPNRFLWDAFILEKAWVENPKDPRLCFYVAQSYQDCGRHDTAIEFYKTCAEKTKWHEERSICFLRIARILHSREGFDEALPWYWKSYNANPQRAEALFPILREYRTKGMYYAAVAVGELASKCDPKDDILFVEAQIYSWRLKDELSLAYHYSGRSKEAVALVKSINKDKIPSREIDRINKNLKYMEDDAAKQA